MFRLCGTIVDIYDTDDGNGRFYDNDGYYFIEDWLEPIEEKTLRRKIEEIDQGKFKELVRSIHIPDACGNCNYFNLSISDPAKRYRCKVMLTCIAATLSWNLVAYINWKLGFITEAEYSLLTRGEYER
jgi:hypothetical protein